jgi:hypothetical protein
MSLSHPAAQLAHTPGASGPSYRGDGIVAFWLNVMAAALYLLLFSGLPLSTDEVALFTGSQGLSQRGVLSASPLYWNRFGTVVFGAAGHAYPNFEPGQMVLAAPLHWLARHLPGIGRLHAVWLFNAFVTAATVALLYLAGRRLGYTQAACLLLAGVFAAGSIALPYARTFFREPLGAFALLLAFYGLIGLDGPRPGRAAALLGAGLGLSYAAKQANLVAAPVFALASLPYLAKLPDTKKRLYAAGSALSAGLVIAGLVYACRLLQDSGLIPAQAARTAADLAVRRPDVVAALFAARDLLFSPGKSFFLYTPFAVAGVLAWPWFYRRHRVPALTCAGVSLALLAGYAYSKGHLWYGGLNWGPRFLVPVTPFVLLPALPALERARTHRWLAVALLALALVSVGVQAFGVVVPLQTYAADMATVAPDAMWTLGIYDWRYTPLARYWQLLNPRGIDFIWARFVNSGGTVDWLPIAAGIIVIILSALALRFTLQRQKFVVSASALKRSLQTFSGIALLVALAFVTLRGSVADPRLPGGADRLSLAQIIDARAMVEDALLLNDHTQTPFYLNALAGPAALYAITGLDQTLSPEDTALFEALQSEHRRVWLISGDSLDALDAPRQVARPDEAWFAARAARLGEIVASPYARATVYVTPAQPLQPETVDATFEDGITLKAAGRSQDAQELYVELLWEASQQPGRDETVFVQLLAPDGTLARQRDSQPQNSFRPTTTWAAREPIRDAYAFSLAGLAPGDYRLIVGLYHVEDGHAVRLKIPATGQDFVELSHVSIR